MKLKSHKIDGIAYRPARQIGGTIAPEIVIVHDTASRLDRGNAAEYLATSSAVSVHFVIERDGTVTQLVPTNRRAAHAGASTWQGRGDCNAFSIGIELVNPGKLTRLAGGSAVAWYGQEFGYGEYKLADITTPQHGAGVWMPYTPDQIEALLDLLAALFAGIPTLRDITTHWYVSPGRKIDTNPLFPLEAIRARVLGRDDPADVAAEAGSVPFGDAEALVQIETPGDTLNLRRWPSFNPNVIATIPDRAVVPVLRAGEFGGRQWLCVLYGGREGWIVARYAAPIIHAPA